MILVIILLIMIAFFIITFGASRGDHAKPFIYKNHQLFEAVEILINNKNVFLPENKDGWRKIKWYTSDKTHYKIQQRSNYVNIKQEDVDSYEKIISLPPKILNQLYIYLTLYSAYIKKETFFTLGFKHTYKTQKIYQLPPGINLIYGYDDIDYKSITNEMWNMFFKDDSVFQSQIRASTRQAYVKGSQYSNYRRDTLQPTLAKKRLIGNQKFSSDIAEIKNVAPVLGSTLEKFCNRLFKLNICFDVNIGLVYTNTDDGIFAHIDDLTVKRGNIYVLNVNRDIYYDLYPWMTKDINPIRIKFPRRNIIELKDDARKLWAHSLPSGIPNIKGRFAVLLRTINSVSNFIYVVIALKRLSREGKLRNVFSNIRTVYLLLRKYLIKSDDLLFTYCGTKIVWNIGSPKIIAIWIMLVGDKLIKDNEPFPHLYELVMQAYLVAFKTDKEPYKYISPDVVIDELNNFGKTNLKSFDELTPSVLKKIIAQYTNYNYNPPFHKKQYYDYCYSTKNSMLMGNIYNSVYTSTRYKRYDLLTEEGARELAHIMNKFGGFKFSFNGFFSSHIELKATDDVKKMTFCEKEIYVPETYLLIKGERINRGDICTPKGALEYICSKLIYLNELTHNRNGIFHTKDPLVAIIYRKYFGINIILEN